MRLVPLLLLLLQLLLQQQLLLFVAAQSEAVVLYSYICLSANTDQCIGISPGESDPYFDPDNLYEIQIKDRVNNVFKGDDYKKMRWNIDFQTTQISLALFSDLCITQPGSDIPRMYLYPCPNGTHTEYNGTFFNETGFNTNFNLTFNLNPSLEGVLQLQGTDQCATVMECLAGTKTYCDPSSNQPVLGGAESNFINGAYVKLRPCYYSPSGDPAWVFAQVFKQRLDCAVGCSPYLQYNGQCEQACDNAACDWDSMKCNSTSPGTASLTPTDQPGTLHPSRRPSVPSLLPTRSPSLAPTSSPLHFFGVVERTATDSPTLSPSPNVQIMSETLWLYLTLLPILLLLLLLCFIFCLVFADRDRHGKDKKKKKNPLCCSFCCQGSGPYKNISTPNSAENQNQQARR